MKLTAGFCVSLRESVLPGRIGEMNLISKASTVHVFEIINRTKLIPIPPQLDSWYHLYQNTPETIYASNGILQTSNKKSLPNVELSSDTWRRRWGSPAPLQQSAGLLQPGGTQSAGQGLFESHLATLA